MQCRRQPPAIRFSHFGERQSEFVEHRPSIPAAVLTAVRVIFDEHCAAEIEERWWVVPRQSEVAAKAGSSELRDRVGRYWRPRRRRRGRRRS